MENSREGWKNRGSDGNRGGRGSRVMFERYLPLHDTVFKKRYRVASRQDIPCCHDCSYYGRALRFRNIFALKSFTESPHSM